MCCALLGGSLCTAETVVTTNDGRVIRGIALSKESVTDETCLRLPGGITSTIRRSEIKTVEQAVSADYIGRRIKEVPLDYAEALIDVALDRNTEEAEIKEIARTFWMRTAKNAVLAGEVGKALSLYSKILTLFPGNSEAAAGLDTCTSALHKLEREGEGLRVHLTENPDNDLARFDLARVYERMDKPDLAFAEYQRIIKGKLAFNGGIDRIGELRDLISESLVETVPVLPKTPSLRGQNSVGPWMTAETKRFLIRFHRGASIDNLAGCAEDALDKCLEAFGNALPQELEIPRMVLHLYATEKEYRAETFEPTASALCRTPSNLYAYEGTPRLLSSALPHEIMHLVTHHVAGNVPLWVDEGLAIRQEAVANLHFARLKQLVVEGKSLSLKEVLTETRSRLARRSKTGHDAFYAASFVLTEFLIDKHEIRGLLEFVQSVHKNGLATEVKRHYGYSSVEELEDEWLEYIMY